MIMNRLMITVAEDGLFFEEPGDLSMRRSQAIVRSYLVLTGLFTLAASLMWAVNALFLLDTGLDIFEVFVVNAAFTVGLVLFEIPTGVVADSTGRRRSFLLSVFILIIGTVGAPARAHARDRPGRPDRDHVPHDHKALLRTRNRSGHPIALSRPLIPFSS